MKQSIFTVCLVEQLNDKVYRMGLRGDTSIEERIDYDLYYIENWTMGFDFKIMFLTIFKGFVNKNACASASILPSEASGG